MSEPEQIRKERGLEAWKIRPRFLVFYLEEDKLPDSGKEMEGKTLHRCHHFGKNDDLSGGNFELSGKI